MRESYVHRLSMTGVFTADVHKIDDVICNVLGAAIGFGLWKLIKGKMHAV
jgi:glycopeptide antibiotics resistance protein